MDKEYQQELIEDLTYIDPITDIAAVKPKTNYVRRTTDEQQENINKENLSKRKSKDEFYFGYTENTNENDTSKRIITDIRPANQMINYHPKTTLRVVKKVMGISFLENTSGENFAEKYMKSGSDVLETIEDTELKNRLAATLQKWNLSPATRVIMDLAGGLTKELSQGEQFLGIKPVFVENNEGKKIIYKWIVAMSYPQIAKCTFGGLVDNNGLFKYGYRDILKHTTVKNLNDFFTRKIVEPSLLCFDNDRNIISSYTPIHLADTNKERAILELDRRYFPLSFDAEGKPINMEQRFLTNIAGLSSIIEIGHYELNKKYPNEVIPNTTVATRFYQTLAAANQFQSILGIHYKNVFMDKENIRVKKDSVFQLIDGEYKDLCLKTEFEKQKFIEQKRTEGLALFETATAQEFFPQEIRVLDEQREEYKIKKFKQLQRKEHLIAEMIYLGLQKTGILAELKASPDADKILLPSLNTNAQYFSEYKDYKDALLIKVEPLKNFI